MEGDSLNEEVRRIVEFDWSHFRITFNCRRFKCPIDSFPFQLSGDLDLIKRIRIEIAQHSKGLMWDQFILYNVRLVNCSFVDVNFKFMLNYYNY